LGVWDPHPRPQFPVLDPLLDGSERARTGPEKASSLGVV